MPAIDSSSPPPGPARQYRRILATLRHMRRLTWCALVVTACGGSPSAPAPAPIRHALYLTHSAGFVHDVLPTSEQVMRDIGAGSGAFDVTSTKDCALVSADSLRGYDVI